MSGNGQRLFWRNHDRDEYACALCDIRGVEFQVHHRNGHPWDNRLENLVGLCVPCHRQIHREGRLHGRNSVDEWKDAFREVLMDV